MSPTRCVLVGLVAVGTAATGTGAAWLVTMYRFPGSRLLEVVLVLPLAFPAYVLAYAYTDFLSHPGAGADALARGHRLGAARLLVPEHPLAAGRGADAGLRLLSLRLSAGAHRLRPAVGDGLSRGADAGAGAGGARSCG